MFDNVIKTKIKEITETICMKCQILLLYGKNHHENMPI